MSKKPEKPEKRPEPELSGRGQVRFHLIKVQVSRAMPKRNPKIRVGSGFEILQVFAHSTSDAHRRFSFRIYYTFAKIIGVSCTQIAAEGC